MTEYTDKQLNYALINSDYDHFLTVSSLRAILNALPEPRTEDEWQPCDFEDRIPAPIVHPDPKEHPVILVTKYDIAAL